MHSGSTVWLRATAPSPSPLSSPLPAGWHHTQQPSLIGATVLLLVLTNVAILVRVYLRRRTQKRLFSDDWILLVSLFLSDGLLSINFVAIKAGLGLHATRVLAQDPSPPDKFIIQAKVAWTNSVLIPSTLFCAKLAILLLLRRIFFSSGRKKLSSISTKASMSESEAEKELEKASTSASSRWRQQSLTIAASMGWFEVSWWINLVYAICMVIATTIIFICQVRPINFYWNELFWILKIPAPMAHPKHVHVVQHPYPGTGIPELVNDFAIVFMAAAACWTVRSKMTSIRKTALAVLFVLGLFAASCGIAKIVYSYKAQPNNDFSWNASNVIVWSCCQVGLTQIIASLPTIVIDLHILHSDRNGYLTKLWPPHPLHFHVPEVFHHLHVGISSRRTSVHVDGTQTPASQYSVSTSGRKKKSTRKSRTHQPSLDSDFEWVTPPRSAVHSNRASLSSSLDPVAVTGNHSIAAIMGMGGVGSGAGAGAGAEQSYFLDDSTTTGAPSTGPQTRNASLGTQESRGQGEVMQQVYLVDGESRLYPAHI